MSELGRLEKFLIKNSAIIMRFVKIESRKIYWEGISFDNEKVEVIANYQGEDVMSEQEEILDYVIVICGGRDKVVVRLNDKKYIQ